MLIEITITTVVILLGGSSKLELVWPLGQPDLVHQGLWPPLRHAIAAGKYVCNILKKEKV